MEATIACLPMMQWELNRSDYYYLNMANEVIEENKHDLRITRDFNRPDIMIYRGPNSNSSYYVELYQSDLIVYKRIGHKRWRLINPDKHDRQKIYQQIQYQNLVWHQDGARIQY